MERGRTTQPGNKPRSFYETYELFYEAYYGIVVGYLKKRVNSTADAEDIAGKVFLYCFEKWDSYDPAKASQITWLFMIVRSKWTDFLRANKAFVEISELDEMLASEGDPIERSIYIQEIRDEVAVLLEKLPDIQRKAIVLRFIGEFSDNEIAKKLGTTAGNVRVIIHRGLTKIRKEATFQNLLEEE